MTEISSTDKGKKADGIETEFLTDSPSSESQQSIQVTASVSPQAAVADGQIKQTVRLVVTNYFGHKLGRSGAGLAYYLLFALFPLLIFISNLLGRVNLNVDSITNAFAAVLPHDVVDIIESYLLYVSETSNAVMLGFSLVFSIYFPWRAVKGLMDDIRRAYGLRNPKKPFLYIMKQVIYTVVFLVAIAVSLVASTFGKRVLTYFMKLIPQLSALQIPDVIIILWHYLRFALIGLVLFGALAALYALAQDERQPLSAILPGAVLAVVACVIVSIGFSFYVENFANYSIIYGTLGAVIVLLLWLYITAVILILGAELNAAIRAVRAEKTALNDL